MVRRRKHKCMRKNVCTRARVCPARVLGELEARAPRRIPRLGGRVARKRAHCTRRTLDLLARRTQIACSAGRVGDECGGARLAGAWRQRLCCNKRRNQRREMWRTIRIAARRQKTRKKCKFVRRAHLARR